jgi:hypothetical protein
VLLVEEGETRRMPEVLLTMEGVRLSACGVISDFLTSSAVFGSFKEFDLGDTGRGYVSNFDVIDKKYYLRRCLSNHPLTALRQFFFLPPFSFD